MVSKILDGEEDDVINAVKLKLKPVIENYAPEPTEPYLVETKLIRD